MQYEDIILNEKYTKYMKDRKELVERLNTVVRERKKIRTDFFESKIKQSLYGELEHFLHKKCCVIGNNIVNLNNKISQLEKELKLAHKNKSQ